MTERMLVVGAGAVGGYFGGRLAAAGRDVTFLVRPERAKALRTLGLVIESPHGDLTLTPKLSLADALNEPYDIIFLALKGYALDAALDSFAPAVGSGTLILPVLNGMRHIETLSERFGAGAVVGGVCRIAAELQDGKVRQLSPMQQLAYGELDGSETPRVRALDAFLQGQGFEAAISLHIVQDMWNKWVQLAALGGVTCLLGGSVGAIAREDGGRKTATALLNECLAIARANGSGPGDAYAKSMEAFLTDRSSAMTASMYRDMRSGAPVEVETILGDLVERGRKVGVSAPLLEAAAVALRVYAAGRGD